jgi:hypothetical protein
MNHSRKARQMSRLSRELQRPVPILLILGFLLSFAPMACGQTTQPTFIVGVFQQPSESFQKWRDLGINTIINPVWGPDQQSKTPADVVNKAHTLKLWTVGNFDECDAYNQTDEPDGNGELIETTIARYKMWKAKSPNKLVFLNLDGRRRVWTSSSTYVQYANACDWFGMDRYPCSTGEVSNIPLIAADLDMMNFAAGGKKNLFYIVECSDQHIGKFPGTWLYGTDQGKLCRPPTAAEMRQEIDLARQHGAKAIIYFPHDPCGNNGGWASFDSITPEIRAAMPTINMALSPSIPPVGSTHHVTVDGVEYAPVK